ncbi:MAG: single-stranded DNA-binding protein, partial [Dehalococcoidia bacterium]
LPVVACQGGRKGAGDMAGPSLNKVILIGNLGTDPEMRYTANGNATTTFRLAINYSYTGPDRERREETEWFTVVTWRNLAEQCSQYLQKGRRVYVEGRLRSRTWEGPDGQRRFRNEVIANRVIFLDRTPGPAPADEAESEAIEPEELPFE